MLGDPSQEMLSFKEVYLFVGAPSRPPARLVLLLPRVGHHLLCSMPTAGKVHGWQLISRSEERRGSVCCCPAIEVISPCVQDSALTQLNEVFQFNDRTLSHKPA